MEIGSGIPGIRTRERGDGCGIEITPSFPTYLRPAGQGARPPPARPGAPAGAAADGARVVLLPASLGGKVERVRALACALLLVDDLMRRGGISIAGLAIGNLCGLKRRRASEFFRQGDAADVPIRLRGTCQGPCGLHIGQWKVHHPCSHLCCFCGRPSASRRLRFFVGTHHHHRFDGESRRRRAAVKKDRRTQARPFDPARLGAGAGPAERCRRPSHAYKSRGGNV